MVFDDNFSTIPNMRKGTVPNNWKNLFDNHRESAIQENFEKAKRWSMDFNNDTLPSSLDDTDDNSPISEIAQDSNSTPRQSNISSNEGEDVLVNEGDGLVQNVITNKGASTDKPSSTSMPSI